MRDDQAELLSGDKALAVLVGFTHELLDDCRCVGAGRLSEHSANKLIELVHSELESRALLRGDRADPRLDLLDLTVRQAARAALLVFLVARRRHPDKLCSL